MAKKAPVIAIDGPAASGKGTIASAVAAHFGLPHLDTGLLYRATALALRRQGRPGDDTQAAVAAAKSLTTADLESEDLRGGNIGEAASVVAAIPEVREALVALQRAFANSGAGAVLDGRDIGTFICPEAPVKLFVTASAAERARRRALELEARGEPLAYDDVLADILKRDDRDSSRSAAPLRRADDAILLDTTDLGVDASIAAAIAAAETRLAGSA